ncbi:MAG: ATP-binding protein, partial [Candidatus Obscuribacterales bacterium]|nr:ATP-binding protein [Candidatus Obscuribacterales bacterium]
SMEGIVRKLREICYDLSPRDLSDWGLTTVVEDMLDQMAQRTGIDCVLNCDIEMPVMPAAVLLHIYRIIQESLNNAEKYAEPTRVAVTIEMDKEKFVATIADNGKGFDQSTGSEKSGKEGGYGMGSLKERADLIRCFYPTKFFINSAPGKGSQVRLEIDMARFQ